MIWDLAHDLVTAMQDRLLELYATAQKKKQAVEDKARAATAESSADKGHPGTASSRSGVRTGGGIVGDAQRQRPATAATDDRVAKKLPASRMPVWAAGKGDSVSESVASVPGGKWAARVDPTRGAGGGVDRNKLTLEMTVEEATWRPPHSPASSPASRRVDDMESSDDVLIVGDKDDMGGVLSSSDDEEVAAGDEAEEDDVLNRTSHNLDELENAAVRLEGWLEKKVIMPVKIFLFY
jgi:hypothetical protein